MRVVKKENRTNTFYNGLKIEHLTSRGGLQTMIVEFPPGASKGQPNAHEGEECHLVLEGKIIAEQGEDIVVADEGDSFSWNASVPHFVKIIGEEKAVVLISTYSDTELNDIF
ncbi:cupin domain-containing protein [Niallia sp. 03133]|uniref:cupin domain-containing protein n=1 Tax=Niallia sp. 03133 TaxID=3458060 RepID=UPI004043E6E7